MCTQDFEAIFDRHRQAIERTRTLEAYVGRITERQAKLLKPIVEDLRSYIELEQDIDALIALHSRLVVLPPFGFRTQLRKAIDNKLDDHGTKPSPMAAWIWRFYGLLAALMILIVSLRDSH